MEKEKVSVIVPVFNAQSTLKSCIDSIINQTYQNLEILIINDGSTDDSMNIIKEFQTFDNRIVSFYAENTSVSKTRNIGITNATGDYVIFVDADDRIKKDAIDKMVDAISQGYDFVRFNYYYSNAEQLDSNIGQAIDKNLLVIKDEQTKEEILMQLLCGKISTFVWLLIIKREMLNKILPFNTAIDFMEDKLVYIDLFSCSNNFLLSNEPIYYYFYKDFEKNDYDYWNKYLIQANLVFENIKIILKKNHYDSTLLNNLVNSLAMSMLNEIVYKIYHVEKKMKVNVIKEKIYLCDKEFLHAYTSKHNSRFSNICIKFINKNRFEMLKIMYAIKKGAKRR